MNDEPGRDSKKRSGDTGGVFARLLAAFFQDAVRMVIAFGVGTGATAMVCLYYGLPLALSLIGGFIVLGIALALMSDGVF